MFHVNLFRLQSLRLARRPLGNGVFLAEAREPAHIGAGCLEVAAGLGWPGQAGTVWSSIWEPFSEARITQLFRHLGPESGPIYRLGLGSRRAWIGLDTGLEWTRYGPVMAGCFQKKCLRVGGKREGKF